MNSKNKELLGEVFSELEKGTKTFIELADKYPELWGPCSCNPVVDFIVEVLG